MVLVENSETSRLPNIKLFLLIVMIIFSLTFASLMALARENHVTVAAPSLNVRYGPGLSHDVMTQVHESDRLQVIGEENHWLKVRLNDDKIGWVASWLVDQEDIAPDKTKYGKIVNAPEVNLRQFANAESQLIGTISEGAEVEVLYAADGWYQILYQGQVAWINGDYVQMIESPTTIYSVDVSDGAEAPVVQIGNRPVNIRVAPSETSESIGTAEPYKTYTYLHTEGDWYCIQVNDGTVGYVASWLSHLHAPTDSAGNPISGADTEAFASYMARSDTRLAEATIVIDPGHGGQDPGAVAPNGQVYEKNLAYNTSLLLYKRLVSAGANVIMTRTDDSYVSLEERTKTSNDHNADLFISLHYDSRDIPNSATGTTTYYYDESDYGVAQIINHHLALQTPLSNNGIQFGNYHVLRENNQPAILLELGYMNNDDDYAYITDPTYQATVAEAIFQALQAYFSG